MCASVSIAEDAMGEYTFDDGRYSIKFPDFFEVYHENGDDTSWMENTGSQLFCAYDGAEKFVWIDVYREIFSENSNLDDRESITYVGKAWIERLKEVEYEILFMEPYIGEYNNFAKVAYSGESGSCYLDFVTVINGDLIVISASSYNGQFSIEENFMLNKCSDTLRVERLTLRQSV